MKILYFVYVVLLSTLLSSFIYSMDSEKKAGLNFQEQDLSIAQLLEHQEPINEELLIFETLRKRETDECTQEGPDAKKQKIKEQPLNTDEIFSQQHLIENIAQHLSIPDIHSLSLCSKTLFAKTKTLKYEKILEPFMLEMRNPINYVIAQAHHNTAVSINGVTMPTQQVLDYLFDHIAQILIANKYDPIRYVLKKANGKPKVILYGRSLDTTDLLQKLYALGADVNKTADYGAAYKQHYLEVGDRDDSLPPLLDRINLPEMVYQQLNEEQKLDIAQWHLVDTNTAEEIFREREIRGLTDDNYFQDYLEACTRIAREHPHDGIVLKLERGIELNRVQIEQLALFNIVVLQAACSEFPDGLKSLDKLQHLRELYIWIDVNECPADQPLLPKELCELPQLRTLYIGASETPAKQETTIPHEICNLKKLRYLDLRTFCIKQVPSTIGQLQHLRVLCMYSSFFSTPLPTELGALLNLRFFECSGQQLPGLLDTFPNICHLKKLQILYLGMNKIKVLPDDIQHCVSLKKLFIGSNPIKKMPHRLQQLSSMQLFSASIDNNSKINFSLLQDLTHIPEFMLDGLFYTHAKLAQLLSLRERSLVNKEKLKYTLQDQQFLQQATPFELMAYKLLYALTFDFITDKGLSLFSNLSEQHISMLYEYLGKLSLMK